MVSTSCERPPALPADILNLTNSKSNAQKILASGCLFGQEVTYRGDSNKVESDLLKKHIDEGKVITICPEVMGGLVVPRPAAEIMDSSTGEDVLGGNAVVRTGEGIDVTEHFVKGAYSALKIAHDNAIKVAILKERSPSYGSKQIYNDSFGKKKLLEWVSQLLCLEEMVLLFLVKIKSTRQ